MPKLLLLGGTREALALAQATAGTRGFHTITSLAGRTSRPARIPGEVRVGGFGGAAGLARYLEDQDINLVVDATHPFAAVMAENAARACHKTGVPRLKLLRPAWKRQAGDRWIEVAGAAEAAAILPGLGRRIFLTTGRRDLAAFEGPADLWFLVRLVEQPETPLPLAAYELVLARGPFAEVEEIELMRAHRVEALVTKNSGGDSTYAKVAAARRLALSVVMICRPEGPAGETVGTVDEALAWIFAHAG